MASTRVIDADVVEGVRRGLERVRTRVADAGGDPDRIAVVAVTKGFPAEAGQAAAQAGVRDLGESYAQELVAKAVQVDGGIRWHFIGRLQRNKVRSVASVVSLWQSVDRVELVEELVRRAPGAAVLVQVDTAGEAGKGGCAPSDAGELVRRAIDGGLAVRGLMAVGPAGRPAGPAFAALARLADDLHLPERSMGMSADLEDAVRAGSTMLRVGTALFGARPPRS